MRGRETGTEDANRAAKFLVERVQRLGLEPAGDSLYVQRVPLQRDTFGPSSRIAVEDAAGVTTLRIGADVIPLVNLGPGIPPTKRSADGPIVFAGYGMATTKPKRDDLAGLDLAGKVVVVVNGAPAGVDSATRATMEAETAISERLARILPQRPAAVIVLMTGKGAELIPADGAAGLSAACRAAHERRRHPGLRPPDSHDPPRRPSRRFAAAAGGLAGGRSPADAVRSALHREGGSAA